MRLDNQVNFETQLIFGLVALAIAMGLITWAYTARRSRKRRRHRRMRERYGPEYGRTVRAAGTLAVSHHPNSADRGELQPLTREQTDELAREWRRLQARFVDDPYGVVVEADQLVTEVLAARGYAPEILQKRAEDVSSDFRDVIENYRTARTLLLRRERDEAGTEELRQAVVCYRAVFDRLLQVGESQPRRVS